MFVMPHHEMKGDHYMYPCLSLLMNEHLFQGKWLIDSFKGKWLEEKLSYETNASLSFIPMRRMCLWHPIMKIRRSLHESDLSQLIDEL